MIGLGLFVACGGSEKPAKKKRVVVTETKVELLPEITFAEGTTLAENAYATIEATATTLTGNPDIELVAVTALAESQELSGQRGRVVMDELIKRGVAAERLKNQPKVGPEAVEFRILRRSGD